MALILTVNNVAAGERDKYDYLWLDPDKSVYVLRPDFINTFRMLIN